jgi:hypothetical protein
MVVKQHEFTDFEERRKDRQQGTGHGPQADGIHQKQRQYGKHPECGKVNQSVRVNQNEVIEYLNRICFPRGADRVFRAEREK